MSADTTTSNELMPQYQPAYLATAADRAALEPRRLLRVNLDVLVTVITVLSAVPRMRLLHSEIVATRHCQDTVATLTWPPSHELRGATRPLFVTPSDRTSETGRARDVT